MRFPFIAFCFCSDKRNSCCVEFQCRLKSWLFLYCLPLLVSRSSFSDKKRWVKAKTTGLQSDLPPQQELRARPDIYLVVVLVRHIVSASLSTTQNTVYKGQGVCCIDTTVIRKSYKETAAAAPICRQALGKAEYSNLNAVPTSAGISISCRIR